MIDEAVRNQGWRLERGKRHYKLYPPDRTMRMVTVSTTPGGRGFRAKVLADMKRSGFMWPPPRKEKR